MNRIACFLLGIAGMQIIAAVLWVIGALVDKALFEGWPWEDYECQGSRGLLFIKPTALGLGCVAVGLLISVLATATINLGCAIGKVLFGV